MDIRMRVNHDYKLWLKTFCDTLHFTEADAVSSAMILLAQATGYPLPPGRSKRRPDRGPLAGPIESRRKPSTGAQS